MATKKEKSTVIWRLRVPLKLAEQVKALAVREHRSTTKQAHALLETALAQHVHEQFAAVLNGVIK